MRKAFITGITGQDGSYLAELLLEKNYLVYGLVRRSSVANRERILKILDNPNLTLVYGDLSDGANLRQHLTMIRPDEVYNLAAQSHVRISFDMPEYTGDINALGTLRLIEAVRQVDPNIKFYQASTSELYGKVKEIPQNEETPFYPRSPYGIAKQYAYWTINNYREAYNMYAVNGILFNHESPRRPINFVSKKITVAVAKRVAGHKNILKLGNLDAQRDWGYAPDFVEGMWLMLQQKNPEDFVLATGKTFKVRTFVEKAFKHIGIDIKWEGTSLDEKGLDKDTGEILVTIDPIYYRPSEVDLLIGDPTKAKQLLNWESKTSIDDLIKIMVNYDIEEVKNEISIK